MKRRTFLIAVLGLALAAGAARAADPHKLALQISDADPAKMTAVLDIAANVSRHYTGKGEEVEIAVVAFNGGIGMLLADRSPVAERLTQFERSMPNVRFEACNQTLAGVEKREGKRPPLLPGVAVVDAGVPELMDLSEQGYTVVRP
ncbi:MAG TPA: hypothetical protein VEF36_11260 [Roseiarcus sp.]|nr:hypothetical protein [Roseiarcus sp.]